MARRSTKNKPVTYRPPFRNSGNFVLDSLGMVLCQFMPTEFIRVNGETHETAKWVVDALNSHAAKGACGIAEAAAKLDSSPTGERLSTVGAETCEALEDIFLICCKAGSSIGYDVACGCIKSKARHALSSLARNFDMSAYAESVRQAWLEYEKNWDELGSPKLELHEWILSRGTERRDADDENP